MLISFWNSPLDYGGRTPEWWSDRTMFESWEEYIFGGTLLGLGWNSLIATTLPLPLFLLSLRA